MFISMRSARRTLACEGMHRKTWVPLVSTSAPSKQQCPHQHQLVCGQIVPWRTVAQLPCKDIRLLLILCGLSKSYQEPLVDKSSRWKVSLPYHLPHKAEISNCNLIVNYAWTLPLAFLPFARAGNFRGMIPIPRNRYDTHRTPVRTSTVSRTDR